MRQVLYWFQPLALAGLVAFWYFVPDSLVASGWTMTGLTVIVSGVVLGLELVAERHAGWRMNWREFGTDSFYLLFGMTVIDWCARHFADSPLEALKQHLGIATPWIAGAPFLLQVALAVFLVEFGQYWMHRGMHNWTPLWLTHAPHHHITQLNAMKGAVGNPIELFLISLSVMALLDFSERAALAAFSILVLVPTCAHANVRFINPRWYALFFTTIENHSLHHSVPYEDTRCNYANALILIDRLFGTYKDGEASVVGQGDRRRLSILEQFRFPFDPLIAYFRKASAG